MKNAFVPNSLEKRLNECITDGALDFNKLEEVKQNWELTECHIAVMGTSGVGKSSLINNLLGQKRKKKAEEYVFFYLPSLYLHPTKRRSKGRDNEVHARKPSKLHPYICSSRIT
jgi:GTPase SAR1 family protein